MQCPACNAENPDDTARCTACGASFSRRARRGGRAQDVYSPFSPHIAPPNRGAAWAYRVAVAGLVPGLGLVLGLVAAVMGWAALRKNREKPEFTATPLARFAIGLGLLEGATNWIGLYLMIANWPWSG